MYEGEDKYDSYIKTNQIIAPKKKTVKRFYIEFKKLRKNSAHTSRSVDRAGNFVKSASIIQGDLSALLQGDSLYFRQPPAGMDDMAGIVAFTPMGNGGHVGAVCFDHQPVQGNGLGRRHSPPGILVGKHSGERNHPAEIHQLFGHLGAAGKAMEHALHLWKLPYYGQAVPMSVSVMDNDGQAQLLREGHLGAEYLLLEFLGWIFLPVVEEKKQ